MHLSIYRIKSGKGDDLGPQMVYRHWGFAQKLRVWGKIWATPSPLNFRSYASIKNSSFYLILGWWVDFEHTSQRRSFYFNFRSTSWFRAHFSKSILLSNFRSTSWFLAHFSMSIRRRKFSRRSFVGSNTTAQKERNTSQE